MGKYFTLPELTRSAMAEACGLTNTPSRKQSENLELLIEKLLDPLRELWGASITVNSGYRSPQLNSLVGGAARSAHIDGEAADITAGSRAANSALFDLICDNGLEFDQLIDESNFSWLHVSFRRKGNRKQVFSL